MTKNIVNTNNIEDAKHIVELFEKLNDEEKNQCLIYISALADRAVMQNKLEES